MNATKVSRSDVGIHNSLTAWFNLQNGEKIVSHLYTDVVDLVFREHSVIWVEADVKSVIRAAHNRGGAIEHEIALDVARKERYEQAMQHIAASSQTRTSARRATEEKQPIIDEYNKISTHTHLPLSMAQLALHRALNNMSEKGKKLKADNEEEEKKMQVLIKERKKAEQTAHDKEKTEAAREAARKKQEETKAKAEKEVKKTREINTKLYKALTEYNRDGYKRKREEGQARAAFVNIASELIELELKKRRKKEQDESEEKKDGEENKENVENVMPT